MSIDKNAFMFIPIFIARTPFFAIELSLIIADSTSSFLALRFHKQSISEKYG